MNRAYEVVSALSQVVGNPKMPWWVVEKHLDKGILKSLGVEKQMDRIELQLAWREWNKVNWLH